MKIRMFLCLILLAVALAPVSGSADDNRGQREHPGRRLWRELNLTPEQEVKFREINSRHAPVRRDNARMIESLREKINQELLRDKPSRSTLIQYAGQMGELQKKMNIASIDHLLNVKAVLTPEQFRKFTNRVPMGNPGSAGSSSSGSRGRTHESSSDGDDGADDE